MSTAGLTFPQRADAFTRYSEEHAIPYVLRRPLAANEQPAKFWFLQQNASGYMLAAPATSAANYITMGVAERDVQTTGSTNGAAELAVYTEFVIGPDQSTGAGDAFVDSDFGAPFYVVNNNTIGKKSNLSGNNRSLGGLFFGLDFEQSKPVISVGPYAWLMARATLLTNAKLGAWHIMSDAAANTATAEMSIHREQLHGAVTAVQFIPGAGVAASNTDYATITISKRDGAGGAPVVVATYDTRAANQGAMTQWVPASFSLSAVAGALNLLETDIITLTVTKSGAGQQLIGTIRLVQKVQ